VTSKFRTVKTVLGNQLYLLFQIGIASLQLATWVVLRKLVVAEKKAGGAVHLFEFFGCFVRQQAISNLEIPEQ